MKIAILSAVFYPQLHPRAFRATELALEFAREGHDVTAINLKTIDGFDYDAYSNNNGIKIVNLGISKSEGATQKADTKKGILSAFMHFVKYYLLSGRLFWKSSQIASKLDCLNAMDMVIALSTPFDVHYGFAKYINKKGKKFVAIADSGDPFYYSKQTRRAIWFKYIEKWVYKKIDYLTIPTENAIPLYTPLISENKIKIIPQGFDMSHLKLYKGGFSTPVKFAYAGVFYWDIRNPKFLFDYLERCDTDYEFHLFMRSQDSIFDSMMKNYKNLPSKIKITYNVPHDELIYELSKMHFLINIENLSNTQMPSKLIDYGMAGRPIYSCNENSFEEIKIKQFMNGDYKESYNVDLKKYDIRNIAKQFIDLK